MDPASAAAPSRPHEQHGLAALVAGGILAVWAAALVTALHAIGTRPDRSGELLAVFPPALGAGVDLVRVARADGVLLGGTWLPSVWQVHGESRDFSAALRSQGAMLVLPPVAPAVFAVDGCFGGNAIGRARADLSG